MNLTKILPILKQVYRVCSVLEASLNSLINIADAAGITLSESMIDIINKVISGTGSVKSALEKIIGFFGGEIDVMAMSSNLDEEVKKLSELL